jgi:hypothetical protein
MRLMAPLVHLPIPRKLLPYKLLSGIPLLVIVLLPPPHVLIVVEYGGTYCLLGAILADDIVVYPLLQVPRIEFGNGELGLVEHGPAATFECRVIAAGEARVEIGRSSRCAKWPRRRQGGTAD